MIAGTVTPELEAVVRLWVEAPDGRVEIVPMAP